MLGAKLAKPFIAITYTASVPTEDSHGAAGGVQGAGGIIVANTHIVFKPKRGDVKLGQLRTVLER
jgi:hypothetical protein